MSTFFYGANNALGCLEGVGEVSLTAGRKSVVSAVTIDALAANTKLTPDVIKIDVEGAEYKVLLGAVDTLTQARPKLFLSVHSESLYAQCSQLLAQYGYDCIPLHQSRTGVGEWYCSY